MVRYWGPAEWSDQRPARGQGDVTSLVVLEYLGGDLLNAEVFRDGQQVEYHYWNQLSDGSTVDLTKDQFRGGETIGEPNLVTCATIKSKLPTARTELLDRLDILRRTVAANLDLTYEPDLVAVLGKHEDSLST